MKTCHYCGVRLKMKAAWVCERCFKVHWRPWDRPEWDTTNELESG